MKSRREVLAATGIAMGLAGCSDSTDSGDGAAEENDESTPDGIQLGEILLQGTDGDETHSVQIAVEGDSGVVHLDTYAVEPGESAVHVDRDWGDSYAEYVINIRVGGQQRRRIDVLEQTERAGGCADLLIVLAADGDVSVWDRSCVEHGDEDESPDDPDESEDEGADE